LETAGEAPPAGTSPPPRLDDWEHEVGGREVERPACRCQPTPRAALAPRRGPRRPAQRLGPPRPREARGAWCSWTPRSACQRMGGSGGVPPWDVSLNSPSDWGRRRSDHDQDAAGSCRPRSRSRSTPADADSPG
ncbi:unnamed protein product, partial [Prorocentrum cordatum]